MQTASYRTADFLEVCGIEQRVRDLHEAHVLFVVCQKWPRLITMFGIWIVIQLHRSTPGSKGNDWNY
jgi:hypothetical protein